MGTNLECSRNKEGTQGGRVNKGRIILDDLREAADGELWLGLVAHCKDFGFSSV